MLKKNNRKLLSVLMLSHNGIYRFKSYSFIKILTPCITS